MFTRLFPFFFFPPSFLLPSLPMCGFPISIQLLFVFLFLSMSVVFSQSFELETGFWPVGALNA